MFGSLDGKIFPQQPRDETGHLTSPRPLVRLPSTMYFVIIAHWFRNSQPRSSLIREIQRMSTEVSRKLSPRNTNHANHGYFSSSIIRMHFTTVCALEVSETKYPPGRDLTPTLTVYKYLASTPKIIEDTKSKLTQ